MTTIRDKTTNKEELQFAVARLCRLLFSFGMELAPYEPITVMTPTEAPFTGMTLKHKSGSGSGGDSKAIATHTSSVCAVSIVRSGEALERTFCESFPDVSVGKIVINANRAKGEGPRVCHVSPSCYLCTLRSALCTDWLMKLSVVGCWLVLCMQLYWAKFPDGIEKFRRVLLMDAVLATGNAAIMAVHVLKDHGVSDENIVFYCLSAAPIGIHALVCALLSLLPCICSVLCSLVCDLCVISCINSRNCICVSQVRRRV